MLGLWRRLKATRRGRLLLRLGLYGGAVVFGLPGAFSQVLVGTTRQPVSPAPAGVQELAVACEGLRLRAWLYAGTPARAAAVVIHGVGDSLEGMTDVAGTLVRRGHTVLLLDLRGHGGSQGRHMSLGGREREDVRAAMGELERRGLAPKGILLMGCSMGAVAVLRAAVDRDDVRAVVAEAPFDTYRETVAHHARLLYGMPRWIPLIPAAIALAEWRAGFDADEVDAVAAARAIRAPLLAIADGADPRMPEAVVRRVYDAHPGPKRFWVAPGAEHTGARILNDYWKKVFAFLDENGV